MLKIAVCDDEPAVAEELAAMIRACLPDHAVTTCLCGGDLLAVPPFDLILLDIQMAQPDGLSVARQLRARGDEALIVFVTGAREHVFTAFDVGAFHYLVKPVQPEKLREVLHRAARELQKRAERAGKEEPRLLIKVQGKSFSVPAADILFLENAGRKLILHTAAETISFYGAMAGYERLLGEGFYRSHRGYLVNLARVVEYDTENIWFSNGERAYLAREKYADFVKRYMRFLRGGGVQ